MRKVANGIGTQVATCMINKWMAKINEEEIYNTRGPPRMKRERGEKKRKEGQSQFLPPPKASVAKCKRTEKKKNQSEDKLSPFPHVFDHSIFI